MEAGAPTGSLEEALAHAGRLMATDPALAEAQARAILEAVPGHPQAELILGAALRARGDAAAAVTVLRPLAESQPKAARAHLELGLALAEQGEGAAAITALRRATTINPELADAWRALGDELTLAGDAAAADAAYARQIKASTRDPELLKAAVALCDNKLAVAETLLRGFLKRHPTDVAAIRMLAETGGRLGRYEDAETLLERCLELAPGFTAARHNYALVLHRQNKSTEALAEIDRLLKLDPRNPGYRSLRAATLVRVGEYEAAIGDYERLLKAYPEQPKAWMSYGHALKTVGRQDEGIGAYRKGIALMPALGEAWWSLANLKTVSFSDADLDAMRKALEQPDLEEEDRLHLHFALGKALEDRGEWSASFEHYAQGAKIRHESGEYDPDEMTSHVDRSIKVFTPEFFSSRSGFGSPAPDPIFIVGLPRAGSTLVEQILSSHSQVEGTMELPDVIAMARRLGGRKKREDANVYPEVLADLSAENLRALGEEFLERTRVQRKLGRPLFIDKMPNNFAHLGFIHLMLPNATIIDARRHPLACCFSGFKQHFARGQGFTYDLGELGRYYADYVRLLAHVDEVLPGRVHRVIYERLIADPDSEIRALLHHCGLEFEAACLEPHLTQRAVRTASSEQVRRPISAEGVDHWKNFEPWLGPLRQALGPVLDAYPEAPAFVQNDAGQG